MVTLEDIFFKVTSGLTGGVVDDLGTAIVGGISLLLILVGLDLLKEFFAITMMNRAAEKSFDAARHYLGFRDLSESGSMEYDYYNALYRSHMNRSVGLSAKTGRTFEADEGAGFADMGIEFPEEDQETGLVKSDTIHL